MIIPPQITSLTPSAEAVTEGASVTVTAALEAGPGVTLAWDVNGVEQDSRSASLVLSTTRPEVLNVQVTTSWASCPSPFRSAHSTVMVTIDVLPSPATIATVEAQLVGLINGVRASVGRPALVADSTLAAGARAWSAHRLSLVPSADTASHDPAFLADSSWVVRRENVWPGSRASGGLRYGLIDTLASDANTAFVNSPGHLASMVASDVDRVGVGIAFVDRPGPGYEVLVTERFAAL